MRCLSVISAVLLVGWSPSALACSPAPEGWVGSSLLSLIPAEVAPEGAIQLKVSAPETELFSESPLNLHVLEVLDGDYAADAISLNSTNVDNCNSDWAQRSSIEYFVTVLPLRYIDGEPVRSDQGEEQYGGLFYRNVRLPPFTDEPVPEFAEYSEYVDSWFYDMERTTCLHVGDLTEDAWRECVEPGEYVSLQCTNNGSAFVCEEADWPTGRPDDLRRGYDGWPHWGWLDKTMLAILLSLTGIGLAAWSLKRAQK